MYTILALTQKSSATPMESLGSRVDLVMAVNLGPGLRRGGNSRIASSISQICCPQNSLFIFHHARRCAIELFIFH